MFRRFVHLPLRCLHSQAGSNSRQFTRSSRSAYALGASAAVVGYVAWSWSSDCRRISLDSETVPVQKQHSASTENPSPRASDARTLSTPLGDTVDGGEEISSELPDALAEGEDVLEESSGGAFNPETGEINWDCPCLGGMAHGPCGQQFRDAFSCFVYSQAEPKGIDCVEKFKAMQACFREHPDVYSDEIMDDDDDDDEEEL